MRIPNISMTLQTGGDSQTLSGNPWMNKEIQFATRAPSKQRQNCILPIIKKNLFHLTYWTSQKLLISFLLYLPMLTVLLLVDLLLWKRWKKLSKVLTNIKALGPMDGRWRSISTFFTFWEHIWCEQLRSLESVAKYLIL